MFAFPAYQVTGHAQNLSSITLAQTLK